VLAVKPWRLDALARLSVSVVICVFMGSALAGALAYPSGQAAIRLPVFVVLTAGALALAAGALALTLRQWSAEKLPRRFVWLAICLFLSLNLVGLTQYFAGVSRLQTHSFTGVAIGTLSFQGAALVLVGWFLGQHKVGWKEAFGFAAPDAGRAALLGLLVACAAVVLELCYLQSLALFHLKPEEQYVVQVLRMSDSPFKRIYLGIITMTLVPVAEEMLFRGILYPAVKQLGFPRMALWGTALIFAAIHLNAVSFVPLTLLAVALALLYERTNNLLAPIVTHGCFNAMNFVMLFWQQDIQNLLQKSFSHAASP
jgi:membrane protease YdiL (CAAX protease family)